MSRPTSSIRYGTCAVHQTMPPHPVAICSIKRSPFSPAAVPPHESADPLELIGFSTDSPTDLPPPPPSWPSDDEAIARWMLLSGRRRQSSLNDNSSTFGVGRSCRTTVGCPSSTLSCCSRRTTGTGPASVERRGTTSQPGSAGGGGGLFSRTDSAPLPLSDYDDDDPAAPVDERLLQPPSTAPPAPPAAATNPTTSYEHGSGVEDRRPSLKNCPHPMTTTTSVAVCRLWPSTHPAPTYTDKDRHTLFHGHFKHSAF